MENKVLRNVGSVAVATMAMGWSDIPLGYAGHSHLQTKNVPYVQGIPRTSCFLSAIIDGRQVEFSTVAEKFEALAANWLDSQGGRSRTDFTHPAYLQIIGMGKPAVRMLLREVKDCSGNWFLALKSIVGETPIEPDARGNFESATRAWLEWEQKNEHKMEDSQGHVDAIASA